MREQLPLGDALFIPSGFKARWEQLERVHGVDVALSAVTVTDQHIVVIRRGREWVGSRRDGDAKCAEAVWSAMHGST